MFIRSGIFAAALMLGTAAWALPNQSGATVASERVTYDDLDLESQSGDAALLRRIRAAANRVCDFGGMQTMEDFSKSGRCYRAAVSDAQRQMKQLMAARSLGHVLAASTLIIRAK